MPLVGVSFNVECSSCGFLERLLIRSSVFRNNTCCRDLWLLEPISDHCMFLPYFEESALPRVDASSFSGCCVFHAYATCNVIKNQRLIGVDEVMEGISIIPFRAAIRIYVVSVESVHSIWKSSNTAHAGLAPKPQHLPAIVARSGPARLPISGTHLRIRGHLKREAPRVCLSSFVSLDICARMCYR